MPKGSFGRDLVSRIASRVPRRLSELLELGAETAPAAEEDDFARAEALVLRLARDLTSPALAGLFDSSLPSSRLRTILLNASPCRRYALVTLAIRHSYSLRFAAPKLGLAYADLALLALRKASFDGFSPELLFDLGARALVVRANAKRLASRLSGAQTDFNRARFLLRHGTHDPIEKAFLRRLEASLQIDRGDFDAAADLLDASLRTYRRFQHCDMAYALLKRGTVALYLDDQSTAQRHFEEAIASSTDDDLILAAHHNFALSLVFEGRPREALTFFLANRDLRESFAPASYQHRSSWLLGLIYSELGWLDQAEGAFSEARQGFLNPPLPYELAKVSAELALVRFQQGHPEDVQGLLEPVLPYLLEERLYLDARAAVGLILRAAEARALSVGLLQGLVGYLRRREYNPGVSLPVGAA